MIWCNFLHLKWCDNTKVEMFGLKVTTDSYEESDDIV